MKIQLDLINTVILMTIFFSFNLISPTPAMYACEKIVLDQALYFVKANIF